MQFHLSTLFFAMLVIATSMALMGGWGLLLGVYALALSTLFALWLAGICRARDFFMVLLVLPLLASLMLPSSSAAREASPRSRCSNNLKQLALGLMNYCDAHGCLPPAVVTGKDGKPMHSWRVHVLPFVEGANLYRSYKFDEPWNGPTNRALLTAHNAIFVCPSNRSDNASGATTTNYVAVTGPGTVWDDDRSPASPKRRLENDQRLLLVDVIGADIAWSEPRDLTVEDLGSQIDSQSPVSLSNHEKPESHAVLANGQVICLPPSPSPELLRDLATQGPDPALRAEIAARSGQPPDGSQHYGTRLACWLLSILVYTFHVERLGWKHRKRRQGEATEGNDRRGDPATE